MQTLLEQQEKAAIARALVSLKTFGVTGRVYDSAQQAINRASYSTQVHGVDAHSYTEGYMNALAGATPPTMDERVQIYREAFEDIAGVSGVRLYGDPGRAGESKMHALAAARVEKINNFIWAMPSLMTWYFDEVSLAADEQPWFLNETNNEIAVTAIGEDGTPERTRYSKPQAVTPVALFMKSTKIARYKTMDLYRGMIADRIKSTLNLPRDMSIEMDLTYWGLLNLPATSGGAFGAFSYEQGNANPQLRMYNAHSAVDVSQLPTTNDYDLTAPAGTANNPMAFSLTSMDPKITLAIIDYTMRWDDIMDGGRLEWTGDILVPAVDIIGIANAFLPIANSNEQGIQKQITENGYYTFNLFGKNVRLIPSIFITRGTCYPKFNLKPGIAYMKPALDRELTEVNIIENWEQTQMRKVFGGVIIAQRRWRAMRIKYSTASNSSSTDTFHTWPYATQIGSGQSTTETSPYLT